jgi:hypothetical protein
MKTRLKGAGKEFKEVEDNIGGDKENFEESEKECEEVEEPGEEKMDLGTNEDHEANPKFEEDEYF